MLLSIAGYTGKWEIEAERIVIAGVATIEVCGVFFGGWLQLPWKNGGGIVDDSLGEWD